MDFKEELKKYQKIVNEELEKYVKVSDNPEKVLDESVEYSVMAGGKRLRPILVLATYQLFKDDYKKCFPYAIALELIHNFSLIHDDLPGIDNDDFRHGKPTNHKQFNEATAILAGDRLLNKAYNVMSNDLINTNDVEEKEVKLKVLNEFTFAVDKMILGEYLDTELEGQKISLDLLEYIHQNKTGAFLKLAVRAGAELADAPEKDLQKLSRYAEKIGLAFQIKDDILSEEGDPEIMGKPVGNDKELGKCTYVTQLGIEKAKIKLEETIDESLKELKEFGEKALFLKQLAFYIRDRQK